MDEYIAPVALFKLGQDSARNEVWKHGAWPLRLRKFRLDADFQLTQREQPELFFVESGKGMQSSPVGAGSQALAKGSLLVLPPGTTSLIERSHHLEITGIRFLPEWLSDCGSFLFSNEDVMALWASMFWFGRGPHQGFDFNAPHVIHLDEREQASVGADLRDIEYSMSESQPTSMAKLSLLKILLQSAHRLNSYWRGEKHLHWDATTLELVALFERVVDRGIRMNLSQAEKASGVPTPEIERVFHEDIGFTPMVYLERRRAHHAARLMLTSDMTDSDIVDYTGFLKSSRMNNAMESALGRSASAYRSDFCR